MASSVNEVQALVFDVLGTVVDDAGSIRTELEVVLPHAARTPGIAERLAEDWTARFQTLLEPIRARQQPWRSTDELNQQALVETLDAAGVVVGGHAMTRLSRAGHRLRPWPDSAPALRSLTEVYPVVALSNANMSMLVDLNQKAGLRWHYVFSGETVRAYKPDPEVYRFVVQALERRPQELLMVAAHPWDLRGAANIGMRTAFIRRREDESTSARDEFDIEADDLAQLKHFLLTGREP